MPSALPQVSWQPDPGQAPFPLPLYRGRQLSRVKASWVGGGKASLPAPRHVTQEAHLPCPPTLATGSRL